MIPEYKLKHGEKINNIKKFYNNENLVYGLVKIYTMNLCLNYVLDIMQNFIISKNSIIVLFYKR
ncbi:hypothetical protein [Campylobacter majalis]|uniref:hypothetical protein n=1 Tax=Campylobacter majalis TaxID=2790656 RepID=UPI003D68D054